MKIVVTGGGGQLGRALKSLNAPDLEIVALSREAFDIADADAVAAALRDISPDLVVNAAAYTAVDRAESEPHTAFRANRDGAAIVARACAGAGVSLIHISTDFVFDGVATQAYRPGDPENPINVYGASKLAGEEAVATAMPAALILRTSWLYDLAGRNFVTTILNRLKTAGKARVVADQRGSPTSVATLAATIAAAAQVIIREGRGGSLRGVRHFADTGMASWYDLAAAARDEAVACGLLTGAAQVEPIATEDYPTPARRPRFSALDSTLLRQELALPEFSWRDALRSAFQRSAIVGS
jgi:dTDP-4-dehydrorhamnose reductase